MKSGERIEIPEKCKVCKFNSTGWCNLYDNWSNASESLGYYSSTRPEWCKAVAFVVEMEEKEGK